MKKTTFLFVVLFFITGFSSLLGVSDFSDSIKSLKSNVSYSNTFKNNIDNKLLIARNIGSRTYSNRSSSGTSTSTYKYRPTKVYNKPLYRNSNDNTATNYSKNNNVNYKSNHDYYGNSIRKKSIFDTRIANFSIADIMILLLFVLFIYFIIKRVRRNRKFMKDYKAKIKKSKSD